MKRQVLYLINYKKNLKRSYLNILVLILILGALFSVVKLVWGENSSMDTISAQNGVPISEGSREVNPTLFIKTIQHMFPNRSLQKQYQPIFSLEGSVGSLFKSIFKIDFKNPLTFVQAQFPVAASYHEELMASIPKAEDEEPEEDWSREIHLVDYDGDEGTIAVDKNIDGEYYIDKETVKDEEDLGELDEGIYVLGQEDLIDSLNPVAAEAIKNVAKPKSLDIEQDKPSILIYHTHGTESYSPATEGNFHSLRKEYTVISVADVMSAELQKRGYHVIHDDTYHDYPSYNGSYGRSVVTAKGILDKNPTIKVVIDLHRDGYDKIETRANRMQLIENSRTKINGEYVARYQFVIGGKSPNKAAVESFAHFVKAVSDSKYPGFSKEPLVNQYGSYNQYLSDYATLIELGSNTNTIEEAKKAGYYLADVLADALKLLEE